jgi:hypothetical protein
MTLTLLEAVAVSIAFPTCLIAALFVRSVRQRYEKRQIAGDNL